MAFNLDFYKQYQFKFEFRPLGTVLIHYFGDTKTSNKLNNKFTNYLEVDSSDFIRGLISCIGQLDNNGIYGDVEQNRFAVASSSSHLISFFF